MDDTATAPQFLPAEEEETVGLLRAAGEADDAAGIVVPAAE